VSLRELLRASPALYLGCAPYKRYVQQWFLLTLVNPRDLFNWLLIATVYIHAQNHANS